MESRQPPTQIAVGVGVSVGVAFGPELKTNDPAPSALRYGPGRGGAVCAPGAQHADLQGHRLQRRGVRRVRDRLPELGTRP